MAERKTQQNIVIMVIKDNEGKVLPLSEKNVEIVEVSKKFTLDTYTKAKTTEGAFIVMI